MTDDDGNPVVLAVDDEERVTEAYSLWLPDEYTVLTAVDGREALSMMDSSVDVVLLDREMPNMRGDEALDRIREEGYDCRVAMVTGVEPDVDIIEMGFDTYLTKPVTGEDLREVVEDLLSRATFDSRSQRFFALVAKQSTLETERSHGELEESEEYQELTREVERLREELDETFAAMDEEGVQASYRDI
ncbi:response regulator [Salarchaeum japonicum]|uniref:Response regulator n=1 Tax=Salarchaeum japonicum TaxID=555573 RepID=A0AAV3SYD6_9EURY|nr:response regulator [Salarchaeum japonicum]